MAKKLDVLHPPFSLFATKHNSGGVHVVNEWQETAVERKTRVSCCARFLILGLDLVIVDMLIMEFEIGFVRCFCCRLSLDDSRIETGSFASLLPTGVCVLYYYDDSG
jgi:hypothetical protein